MQITQVQVGNLVYPLEEGQLLPIAVGDTLKVFYSFKYVMPKAGSIRVWASLWYGLTRVGPAQTKGSIDLEAAPVETPYEGEIDIVIGNIPAGKYGLICELPDYKDAWEKKEDCIEVTAAPSIWDSIGPLLVLGLMVGMVSMFKEGE